MDKSYRIHTNIISDNLLNVNMQQDFDFLEVLSLKLRQKDAYRLHSSNYGVIIGRVLANDAFGVPNAKISIFIERDSNDSSDMESIYPYSEVTSKDKEGRRYNLLPDYSDDECYRVVGTFPNKRLMLDDDIQLEIYDKYWKYTTVTNNAGDYMLFGVPTGSVTVHVDMDLSDIGVLSQKPRDFEYKGYNLTMFDNPNQFKESTNLDSLAQIFSQNRSVFVYPFWGDADNGIASLTRADIQIQYKFEPTCVFMGSIVSDNEGHSIGHRCEPDVENGMNDQLIGGNGTIEMIRKTTDGLIEEYQIQGNQLIDENGVWCYQIPMNLDFIGTDEYGNIVPTDNPTKGIPTRTQVRFRISKIDNGDEGFSRHTAKYLVPMNPIFSESGTTIGGLGTISKNGIVPVINAPGAEIEKMYNFGSSTPEHCFRDLYWNNVYSVKNYIPKVQIAHRPYSKNYGALKGSNLSEDKNPIPFNKLRIDLPFVYILICIIINIIMIIVFFINSLLCIVYKVIDTVNDIIEVVKEIPLVGTIIPSLDWLLEKISCIALSAGLAEGNTAFYPGCWCDGFGECPEEMEGDCEKQGSGSGNEYMDRIQRNLAQEFKIVKLDLYQDWINGCLYMPLWYWRKRKKKTYWFDFFGLFGSSAKNEFCSCETDSYSRLKTYTTCEIPYDNIKFDVNKEFSSEDEKRWHKNKAEQVRYKRGLIRPFVNNDGLTLYYYSVLQATTNNINENQELNERPENFYGVRLYATDIILLGNLQENNLYGIPQFFKCLPSTTANIPAIATIMEEVGEDEKDKSNVQYESSTDSEDSGKTVVTGMDWRRDSVSEDDSPMYKQGLFMDLGCTFVDTRAKSCINVERLSELGVALDTSYIMRYANDEAKIKTGPIEADGFITKLELDDMENRAMFATLNHIGFIPQTYQQSISAYTTQVLDENTNYLIPKFKYIYPVDFDGRHQIFMDRYKNGFRQPLYDEKDESYLTFRLGAEGNEDYTDNSERRVRHFYIVPNDVDQNCTSDDNMYHMPLYNNSFYFYFGIKKGSTAIDKFNEMFYAKCYKNVKKPFSINVDFRSRSYCPRAYNNPLDGFSYIRVNVDDIITPFTYSLYDENNNLVISESDMRIRDFVIGGKLEAGKPQSNNNGTIFYQKDSEKTVQVEPYSTYGLTNQMYYLTLTDANGKSLTERINLEKSKIDFETEVTDLSSKFYNSATTRIDYICNEDNHFYGSIDITGFSIDGHNCIIDNASYTNYSEDSGYTICITGHSDVSDILVVSFSIKSIEWDEEKREKETKNCMCDKKNDIANEQRASDNMIISGTNINNVAIGIYDIPNDENNGKKVSFFVYQPCTFIATIIQGCQSCNSLVLENSNSKLITVNNAENFNTYLNTMPVNFMIGSVNDSVNASVAYGCYGTKSKFYSLKALTSLSPTVDSGITGWFGVHQESSYMFDIEPNKASDKNKVLWGDYIRVNDDIHTPGMKRNILKMKFDAMFALSNAVYVRDERRNSFQFTSTGGTQPTLLRNIAPCYNNNLKFLKHLEYYLFKDDGTVSFPTDYPNIVGSNASGHSQATLINNGKSVPEWNKNYNNDGHDGKIGNYFAGFTHNGSYLPNSNIEIDGKLNICRQPNFASISPYSNDIIKYLGKDEERNGLSEFKKVHTQDKQQLNGDKMRTVNPWLRALNVDRRFDYDFTVLGPTIGSNFKLHTNDEEERVWKSLRISGFTYNGVEMSYDEEYNIISATTELTASTGEIISQKANKRLEYSYYFSSGDTYEHIGSNGEYVTESPYSSVGDDYGENKYMEASTVYNHENNQVWSTMHLIKYPESSDSSESNLFGFDGGNYDKIDEDHQIIKELYESKFGKYDIRNFYWSSFNKYRLNIYTSGGTSNSQIGGYGINGLFNLNNPFYVFNYPNLMDNLYNGDFNRKDIVFKKGTYPIKRFIDIGNIYPSIQYLFSNQGCSYGIQAIKHSDGTIKCFAKPKENVTLSFSFEQPISFETSNANSKEFGNVIYVNSGKDSDGFNKFYAYFANLSFRYNIKSDNPFQKFDIYTRTPRLIKVLPYTKGTDGISFIKMANPKSEFNGYSDGLSLEGAVEELKIRDFHTPKRNIWDFIEGDVVLPSNVDITDNMTTKMGKQIPGYYFLKDGKPLKSDDNDFANIMFIKNNIILSNVDAFTILVEREYWSKSDDGLTKHLRVIEFPEIYDTRHLLLRSNSSFSYVEYKKIETVTPVNEPNGNNSATTELLYEGDVIRGATTSVEVGVDENVPKEGEGKMYTQVLAFEMKFDTAIEDPQKMQNCVFSETDRMGYVFEFVDASDNKYFIEEGIEISKEDKGNYILVKFIVKWDQNMGILQDRKWNNGNQVRMAIYAKTPSNFTYKLIGRENYFTITLSNQEELPTEEGKKSKTTFIID